MNSAISLAVIQLGSRPVWILFFVLGTALWFGVIGQRTRHAGGFWVIGGLLTGLGVSAISANLANAVALPYTTGVIKKYEAIAFLISLVIIVVLGMALTFMTGDELFRNRGKVQA